MDHVVLIDSEENKTVYADPEFTVLDAVKNPYESMTARPPNQRQWDGIHKTQCVFMRPGGKTAGWKYEEVDQRAYGVLSDFGKEAFSTVGNGGTVEPIPRHIEFGTFVIKVRPSLSTATAFHSSSSRA